MLKKLFALILGVTLAWPCQAQVVIGNAVVGNSTIKNGINVDSSLLRGLLQYNGLTFFKDFSNGTLNAEFSAGNKTGTYTSTRSVSAPATYMDGSGVIQVVTTSDVPLYSLSYGDTLGVHIRNDGYKAERSSTNFLTRTDGTAYGSGLWTGWFGANGTITGSRINSNVAIPDLTSIASSDSQRVQYTGIVTDGNSTVYMSSPLTAVGSVAQNNLLTASFWARSQTGTVATNFVVNINSRNAAGALLTNYTSGNITLSTAWRKFSYSATITDATASRAQIDIGYVLAGINNGSAVDFEIALPQLEVQPYATSFIPTTTAALTRAGDSLKYENALNSTANEETIIVQFAPGSNFNNGQARQMYSTDTKGRIQARSNADTISYANVDDNVAVNSVTTTDVTINTLSILTSVFKHSSPYVATYLNGSAEGTYTAGDWTNPAWGTYFYVGSDRVSANQLDGTIKRKIIFNRALSSTDVSAISTLLANTP